MNTISSKYKQNLTPNIFTIDEGNGEAIDLFFTSQGLCAEQYTAAGNILRRRILWSDELLALLKLVDALSCTDEKSAFIFDGTSENMARKVLRESGTDYAIHEFQIFQ